MADFTQTISNTMNLIGPTERNVWGTMDWGDNWGTDKDMLLSIFKHLGSVGTITASDAYFLAYFKRLGSIGTITETSTMSTLCHFDGNLDFKYVRAGDLGVDGFSKTADGSSGWSKTADGTDDWS
jgi:hypothetical protein